MESGPFIWSGHELNITEIDDIDNDDKWIDRRPTVLLKWETVLLTWERFLLTWETVLLK